MIGEAIAAAAALAGGYMQGKQADKQAAQQREFAQSGIQWRVKDAEKAGIHPLYALGAQTTSYQPTSVGGGLGSAIGEAGQNIGRAIDSTRSTPATALALQASKAQIEGLNLDNELKKTQLASAIALANQTGPHPALPGSGDVYPLPGQGDSGVISSVPPGHQARAPQFTSPDLALWGHKWQRRPGSSDAQTWEDVYGDESLTPAIINNTNGYLDLLFNSSDVYRRHILNKLRR